MLNRTTSQLARWRVAATLFAASSLIAFGATAQETDETDEGSEDAVEFETFEVTGSRIKRSDYETASPVLVIDREAIERTGLNSIGELIKDLPQAGASLGRAFNNGGDGSVEIDLRNLGSTRVLVLVDGRRWIPGTRVLGGGGVDLSTIPISIVERIEVLQDGASAVYGSDAVAGVVNIITRKDFQGLESRFQTGAYDDGEGFEKTASFAAGQVSGNTSVFFDVSYRQIDPLGAGDRAISSVPTFGVPNASRGSLFTPEGTFLFVTDNARAANFNAGQEVNPCFTLASAASLAFPTPGSAGLGIPGEPSLPVVDDPGSDALPGAAGPVPSGVVLCNFRFSPEGEGGTNIANYNDFNFNENGFNFAPLNFLITPQERSSLFGQVSHRVNDYVNFDAQVLYNRRESQQQLANNPLITGDLFPFPFNQAFLHEDQEFNPFGQDVGRGDAASGLVGLGAVGRRMLEAGRRDFFQKNETFRVGLDVDGTFDYFNNFFSWELGYTYAESETNTIEEGLQNLQRVAFALGDPANCTPEPEDVDGPCVPLNLTGGLGTITQDMLDYINYTAQDSDRQSQQITYLGLSTEIGQAAEFLPGAIGVAFGIERRVDNLSSQPDPLKINGTSSTNLETVTAGETRVTEGFVEIGVPILRDLPFVEDLNMTLAVRTSKYEIPNAVRDVFETVPNPALDPAADEFDPTATGPEFVQAFAGTERFTQEFSNTSGKIGLEYRPVAGLLVRTGYSDSFRAPSVSELFLGQLQSFPTVTDPCSARNDPARDGEQNIENIRANCDADGVPPGYTQSGSQITTVFGGNSQLDPETADSYNLGFVISPGTVFDMPALDGLDLVVDVFRYELKEFITVPGAGFVLGLCYQAAPSQRSLCEFVNRTAGGQIANLRTVFSNIAELNTDGVDIDMTWDIPFFKEYGNFKNVTTASYTHRYEQVFPSPGGETTTDFVGFSFGVAGIPRWKVNNSLQWSMGPWSASWDIRFIDRTFAICDDGLQALGSLNPATQAGIEDVGSLSDFGLCDVEDANVLGGTVDLVELERTIYNDIQVGYQLPWVGGSLLTFGVRNVLDQDPPVNPTALANSYNVATYDPPGSRQPYLRFTKDF